MRRLLLVLAALVAFGALASTTLGDSSAAPPITIDLPPLPVTTTDLSGADVSYYVKSHLDLDVTCTPTGGPAMDFTATWHFPVGTSTINCTDGTNNASADVTVVFVDTTPPTVSVPGNQSATTNSPSGTVIVTWQDATATDAVDGALPVSCDHTSGSSFPVGTTTVTCTATDSHGNTGSASFTVTVTFVDITAPTFTPNPPPNVSATTSNPAGDAVSYSVSATDDSGNAPTVTCNPASGSTFPVGNTTVNCTAEDAAQHQTSASFTVTLTFVDTTPPAFSNVPGNIVSEANGPAGSVVNYTTPTATDASDGPEIAACLPGSGSTFPLGMSTVACSASDSHGNTGTTSFSVSVVDTTKPTLIVPANRAVYAETPDGISAQSHSVAEFLSQAQAVDSVDPSPHVSSNAPGFFTVGTHVVIFTASDASGNSISKGATLDVRPMPAAGTPTPPLPTPPARTPPKDVTGLKADAGDTRVRLSWKIPGGVDHVVVTHQLSAGGDTQVVYTGSGESFTDRGLVNGLEYRFVVVSVDKSGNTSAGAAVVALPKATLLRSPKDGARVKKPPKLVWARNSEASYYNVQVFRGAIKILSAWPGKPALTLKRTWKFQGHKYKLTPGVYRWYVWPGFGARSAVDYGDMLGFSSFQIVR
jgi:hypothetical protein